MEKLGLFRDKYATRNEDTYVKKYWGKLIRDHREVEVPNESAENQTPVATDLVKKAWEKQAWDADNLDDNWNREFIKESIPAIHTEGDAVATRLLAAHDRVKNPKPDIAYGLDDDAFTDAELQVNSLYNRFAGISPGIWYPGAIVEAKTAGIIEMVECQCARGGAALVNAMRELLCRSGVDVSAPGADTKSAVFSVALIPTCANIHVHWAEKRKDGSTRFHMHLVESYALRNNSQNLLLRRRVNNILDWITLTRKTWIHEMLANIRARDHLAPEQALSEAVVIEGAETAADGHANKEYTVTDQEGEGSEAEAEIIRGKGKKRKL